jgi:hypothetical protein
MRTVQTRRYDEEQGTFVHVEEVWPTAVFDEATRRWAVEGRGWTLRFEGAVTDEQAERICKAAADAIRFES